MASYRVLSDTSTRASDDPSSPAYETWVDFPAGMVVKSWPKHTPVDEWVASGHWVAVAEKPAPPEPDKEAG